MPRDTFAWLTELTTIAPSADRVMLRVLARVLACPGHVDVMLYVAEALQEATTELMLDGRVRLASEIMAIGVLVDREVAGRSARGGFR